MGLFDKLDKPVFMKESSDAQAQLDQLKEFSKTAPDNIKGQVQFLEQAHQVPLKREDLNMMRSHHHTLV